MTPVEMPKANENLTEATLDRWIVKEGDFVAKDQSLCDIITDKAKFEMPAPAAGCILKILAPERALLPVGFILCAIGETGETLPEDLHSRNEALLAAHRSAATSLASPAGSAGHSAPINLATGTGVRATPAARRLAKESGLDLAEIAKALSLAGPVNEKDIKAFLDLKK